MQTFQMDDERRETMKYLSKTMLPQEAREAVFRFAKTDRKAFEAAREEFLKILPTLQENYTAKTKNQMTNY